MCPDKESTEPLDFRIGKWLEQQGYPLEMQTASALRKCGLWVRQSAHYIDEESGKSREIDVLAIEREPLGMAEIYFVIECKTSNKPWILFTSPHALDNYNRLFALGLFSSSGRTAVSNRWDEAEELLKWLKKDMRNGYNLTAAFTNGEDSAFGAASSVVKACSFLLRTAENGPAKLAFTFPAIILSSPLFECYLDDQGEMRVSEIEQGWLFFDARIAKFHGTCIRIVSQSALEQFAADVGEMKMNLRKLIEPDVQQEWKTLKSRSKK
jgi:hypothetical protein